jgi:hypothetical protein
VNFVLTFSFAPITVGAVVVSRVVPQFTATDYTIKPGQVSFFFPGFLSEAFIGFLFGRPLLRCHVGFFSFAVLNFHTVIPFYTARTTA